MQASAHRAAHSHHDHHAPLPTSGRALDATALSATLHCLTGCAIGEVLGMATPGDHDRYVPAAGRLGFTGLYDAGIALTMREARWRPVLRDRLLAAVPSGGRVLDVGAGTGTLAIALATARPDIEVIAVDGDPEVLGLARAKPGADAVRFELGLAGRLELPDDSADAAVMSLVLHHLSPQAKHRALADVSRVLHPGGQLHVADWGRPATPLLRAAFFALQLVDGFDGTRDHAAGRLPRFLRDAGVHDVRRYGRVRTAWGTLELLTATAG